MSKPFGIVALFFALSGYVFAQNTSPESEWQKVRGQQPTALHLKLTLPKDHFFQGEEIDARLDFSNDDTNTIYSLTVGSRPCAVFHAIDEKGHAVVDPVKWVNDWFNSYMGGFSSMNKLGSYTVALPANENIRFDQPGIYSLYASSTVTKGALSTPNPGRVSVVSDPVSITITAITPDQEKQVIAEAVPKISMVDSPSGVDKPTWEGLNELKYLQTPAARAELIHLMARSQLVEPAARGLEGAPDPSAEAEHLLAAVQTGKLVPGPYGATVYGELKVAKLLQQTPFPPDVNNPETKKILMEMATTMKQARDEITASMVQATGSEGPSHAEALWTAFEGVASSRGMPDEKFPDGGAAQRAVAEHQLELSDATVKRLLTYWTSYGGPVFLPVVRREVAKRGDNPNALIALCFIKPDEARPLVLAEMIRADSNFLKGTYVPATLLSVPPMPLPELDAFFRAKLADPNPNPGQILPLIACFGSTSLLPPTLDLYRHHGTAYSWGPDAWVPLYFYWMRCDPSAALVDFDHFFKSNPQNCWAFLNEAFIYHGSDVGLPLLDVVLKSDDASMASGAIDRLMQRGGEPDIDPMLGAMERFQQDKAYGKWLRKDARVILGDERWHLTADQKKRLEALAPAPVSTPGI